MRKGVKFLPQKCPFPGCNHVGDMITNAHTKIHHGMTKKDVFKKYGEPTYLEMCPKKLAQNTRIKTVWAKELERPVTKQI